MPPVRRRSHGGGSLAKPVSRGDVTQSAPLQKTQVGQA